MLQPQMVLMDEPSAGLAPKIAAMILEKLPDLNREISLNRIND
jgi:ABC-type branched-subunit amino acid transport system ATPase component